MPNLVGDDVAMRQVLRIAKRIAVVGHSHKPHRDSYRIAQFLKSVGYEVYPINPVLATIEGQPCYASLNDLPTSVDIVNVFRRSDYLPEIVEAAIAVHVPTLWAQLGIDHPSVAQRALDAGLNVAMNACIKIEYLRLGVTHAKSGSPPPPSA